MTMLWTVALQVWWQSPDECIHV